MRPSGRLEPLLSLASAQPTPLLQSILLDALPGMHVETAGRLAALARIRDVAVDETIFHRGEAVPMILVLEGYGVFRRLTVGGQQVDLGITDQGQVYGIIAIASTISSADLVALTDCRIAFWPGPEARRLAAADAGFALAIIDRQAEFLRVMTENVDGYLHQGARRRVTRVLVRHLDLFFGDDPVLSRSHLPALVGTSREMTSRVLRELEREGILARIGRSGLRLLRPEGLREDG